MAHDRLIVETCKQGPKGKNQVAHFQKFFDLGIVICCNIVPLLVLMLTKINVVVSCSLLQMVLIGAVVIIDFHSIHVQLETVLHSRNDNLCIRNVGVTVKPSNERARFRIRARAMLLFSAVMFVSPSPIGLEVAEAAACRSHLVGVDLDECPLESWSTSSSKEFDSLGNPLINIEYVAYNWMIPGLHPVTGEAIEDSYWNMTVKTYRIEGTKSWVPSPTLRWKKGSKVMMKLTNSLHLDPLGDSRIVIPAENMKDKEYRHNIHTHGLHISADEDNPTVEIYPGESRNYEFNVLPNHAGGIHWYHPHIETLSEMHVGGGAAGALIIEDALDGTELPKEILEMPEKVLVIQKIFPHKLNELHDGYSSLFDAFSGLKPGPREYINDLTFSYPDDQKLIDKLELSSSETFYTFVNGYIRPRLNLVSGKWYRWRMLYVGMEDQEEMLADAWFYIQVPDTLVKCSVKLIAKDGVYLRKSRDLRFDKNERIWLHPASRSDVLVRCDINDTSTPSSNASFIMEVPFAKGTLTPKRSVVVIDMQINTDKSKNANTSSLPTDFWIKPCSPSYLPDMTLNHTIVSNMPPPNANNDDLRSLSLNSYITTEKDESFNVLNIEVTPFNINEETFTGYHLERRKKNITIMRLGEVYQWHLVHGTHPLHIHVNHFQLQHDLKDFTGYHRKGDFLDTLATPCPPEGCSNTPNGRQEIEIATFRMYIDTFLGRVLMHCHNMDHSDTGAVAEAFIIDNPDLPQLPVVTQWEDTCSDSLSVYSSQIVPTLAPSIPRSSAVPTLSPTISPIPVVTNSTELTGSPTYMDTNSTVSGSFGTLPGEKEGRGIFWGTFFLLSSLAFIISLWSHSKDRDQADIVQMTGHVLIREKPSRKKGRKCETSEKRFGKTLKKFNWRAAVYGLPIQENKDNLLDNVVKLHSLLGLFITFNPIVSRVQRLGILICLVLGNFMIVALFSGFHALSFSEDIWLAFVASFVAVPLILISNYCLSVYAVETRKHYHRVALIHQAVNGGVRTGTANTARSALSRSEQQLLEAQLDHFVAKHRLKELHDEHITLLATSERIAYYIKKSFWCCSSKKEIYEKAYGGQLEATNDYEQKRHRLEDLEEIHDIRRTDATKTGLLYLLFALYVILSFLTLLVYMRVDEHNHASQKAWITLSLVAYVFGALVIEPILIILTAWFGIQLYECNIKQRLSDKILKSPRNGSRKPAFSDPDKNSNLSAVSIRIREDSNRAGYKQTSKDKKKRLATKFIS